MFWRLSHVPSLLYQLDNHIRLVAIGCIAAYSYTSWVLGHGLPWNIIDSGKIGPAIQELAKTTTRGLGGPEGSFGEVPTGNTEDPKALKEVVKPFYFFHEFFGPPKPLPTPQQP